MSNKFEVTMLLLEQCVNTFILEEGQLLVPFTDLGITWEQVETLFESTYEQARLYLQKYVKKTMKLDTSPVTIPEAVAIKRVTYDIYMDYNRLVPDIPQQNWNFNPHTKELQTFASTKYVVEYLTYPKCDYLEYSVTLQPDKYGIVKFALPGSFEEDTFRIHQGDVEAAKDYSGDGIEIPIGGELGQGYYNTETYRGRFQFFDGGEADLSPVTISFMTKYKAIEEWDMKNELFIKWFKANFLSMIGSIKEQAGNVDSASMPFDINRDGLLARARELYEKVEELKINKSTWWEF